MPKGKILMGKKTPKPVVPPKPKGKNPPSVIYKNATPDIRNLPGPVMPPPKGGDPIRRKGDRSKMVQAPKPKKPIGRGGR